MTIDTRESYLNAHKGSPSEEIAGARKQHSRRKHYAWMSPIPLPTASVTGAIKLAADILYRLLRRRARLQQLAASLDR